MRDSAAAGPVCSCCAFGLCVFGRGDVATHPEIQEWPFAAFSCALVRLYPLVTLLSMCTGTAMHVSRELHMIVGHFGLHNTVAFGVEMHGKCLF